MRQLLNAVAAALALLGAAPAAHATDPDLESYLDGLLGGLMETHHIPGAVVIMVRDDQVVLAKGYGVADIETRRPVDPERTLFRVASVSKLFVATAVMQLVERGKLQLDTDVNRYLDGFRIQEAFGKPVTLRQLLTHTAGFDDRYLYTAEPLEVPPTPLGDYLAARMPPRVMPPDRFISYSNHGYALAGHLVERSAGLPFGRYVEREIFAPLGMSRSSFGIPTPVPPDVARPYEFREGRHVDLGLDRVRDGPAGDLLTTGADMAHFMLAHLQGGRLGEARLLDESTANEMQREQFRLAPGLAGWCLGFAAEERNGSRAIGHDGSHRGFGTDLTLVPEAGLGWFVSTNRDFHPAFFEALRDGLWDRFFPVKDSTPPRPPADFAARAGRYTGSYVPNRRVRSDFLKASQLFMEERISSGDDGTLIVSMGSSGLPPLRLVEVAPDRFVATDGHTRAVFETDDAGRARHLLLENSVLDRVPAWLSPRNHVIAGLLMAALFVASLAGWGLGVLVRAMGRAAPSPASASARGTAVVVCLADTALLLGFAAVAIDPDIWGLMMEVPLRIKLLLWLPVLSLPLTLVLPVHLLRGFPGEAPATLARLHYALLTGAAFLLLLGTWYWKLTPMGLS